MEMIFIKKDTAEWEHIWNFVANHPINEGIDEPRLAINEGEGWQYMGSYKNGKQIIHEVRHRFHPRTLDVYKLSFNGSESFTDDQTEKTIKIK